MLFLGTAASGQMLLHLFHFTATGILKSVITKFLVKTLIKIDLFPFA